MPIIGNKSHIGHSNLQPQEQHPATASSEVTAPGDVLIDFGSLEAPAGAAEAEPSNSNSQVQSATLEESTETPFAAPDAQAGTNASRQPAPAVSAAHDYSSRSSTPGGPPHAAATAAAAVGPHFVGAHARSQFLDTRRFQSQHFWLSEGRQDAGQQVLKSSVEEEAEAGRVHDRNASTDSFEDLLAGSITEECESMSGSPTKQSLLQHWRQQHQQHRTTGSDPGALSTINSAPAASASGSSNPSFIQCDGGLFGTRQRGNFSYPHGQMDANLSLSGLQHSGLPEQQPDAAAAGNAGDPPAAATASRSKKRWQKAAQRVVQLNKAADTFKPWGLQGLDVKRHNYSELMRPLHTEVKITVADYSNEQVQVVGNITNDSLSLFLDKPRPEWSKVRWLNVQIVGQLDSALLPGLSWDVIQTLAVAYDLHPLSVEDIVHVPQRIKADYYQNYLYASVLLLSVEEPSKLTAAVPLHSDLATAAAWESLDPGPQPSSPAGRNKAATRLGSMFSPQLVPHVTLGQHAAPHKLHRLRTRLLRPSRSRAAVAAASQASLHSMELMVEQASLFLFRDGTVISMFSNEGEGVAESILERLKGFKTLLTDSEDASFLFNTLLDAVVDRSLPVVQIYASRIAALETQVLVEPRPQADITKELHLLGNDLKVLRRTLVPTQHLIHKLQSAHADKGNSQGFLSSLTVVYLSDVLDHISTIVEDMETLAVDARDLIDLVFNTIAHQNNNSMQMLAVVSTIFLPITFIAGVYGTNFDQFFPEIHWQYGYCYFWGICAFITVLFTGLLKYWGMFQR